MRRQTFFEISRHRYIDISKAANRYVDNIDISTENWAAEKTETPQNLDLYRFWTRIFRFLGVCYGKRKDK